MPLSEIARRIRLSKTSALRLLCTLETSGYLKQNAAGQYTLAPEIQNVVTSRFHACLLDAAAPIMAALRRNLRETVSVAALFENRIEIVAVEESQEPIRMGSPAGHISPPHATAVGKIIASFQPEEKREKVLRSCGVYRFTPQTIIDWADLEREFERCRRQGYAVDREESVAGGYSFAVPIFDRAASVPAALSVSLPKARFRGEQQERELIQALQEAASRISGAL
jgi:IclR family acetate operon transcriptional repressor